MPVPFLSSITLNKNEVQDFKVFNVGTGNPTLSSGGDIGYFWTDTTGSKVLKWWDGSAVRTLLDSSSTTIVAADLSGGAAGSLPYQQGASDTTFLGIGTAGQVLTVASGAPAWTSQSNLSVGSATWLNGGAQGDIPVQSAAGTTGFLNIGANGRILTSNGTTPVWSASIPSSSVSGLAASATTDTTNASNISSGTLPLARLALANGSLYVGDASNNPAATAKSSIPLSGFGAAAADVSMGTYKITNLGTPLSTDPDSTAATKGYVDSVAQGLDVKASCVVASTANITLSAPGSITIDGVSSATFTSGTTRILVKDQSAPAENGIYIWNGTGSAMTRSLDANTWDELVGAFTFVETGTANADSGWVCNVNAGGTLGTTAVTWTKFSQAGSYTAGNGMVLSGGVFHFAQSSAYTAGQIPFCSNSPTANSIGFSSNLFWDNSNSRLGIGTATVDGKVHIYGDTYANSQLRIQRNGAVNGTFSIGIAGTNNTLYIQDEVNATARLIIDGSGNLGLGAVPVAADGAAKTFQVGGRTVIQSTVGTQTLFSNNAYYDGTWKRIVEGYSNAIRFNGLGSSGANAGAITFSIAASGSAGSTITNWDSSDIRMVLDASGNLLVGTTTATSKFVVSSSGDTLATIIGGAANAKGISFYDASTNGCQIYSVSSDIRFFTTASGSSTERLRIPSSGEIQAIGQGSASAPIFSRTGDTNTGLYFPAADTLALAVGGSDAVYINSGGNVSIGDSVNGSRLRIVGTNTADGPSAKFLLSLYNSAAQTSGVGSGIGFGTNVGTFNATICTVEGIKENGTSDNYASALKFTTRVNGGDMTERLRIKSTGQINLTGLAADPTGAAGDLYYSTGNVLKMHNGTAWQQLSRKYSTALAGTNTSFTVTHNFGTRDVTVQVRKSGSTYDLVYTDVQMTTENAVTVIFASSVTGSDYTVTVIG